MAGAFALRRRPAPFRSSPGPRDEDVGLRSRRGEFESLTGYQSSVFLGLAGSRGRCSSVGRAPPARGKSWVRVPPSTRRNRPQRAGPPSTV